MKESIICYLADQPFMTVLRSLLRSAEPRHIRDLSSLHSLSPAGVSDILRRLQRLGVLTESKRGNKRCVSLKISENERSILNGLFTAYEAAVLERRAETFSRGALEKFSWIDEARNYARVLHRSTQ